MTRFETFESNAKATVTLTTHVVTACPFNDSRDVYELTVEYVPDGTLLELGSFDHYLKVWGGTEIAHEELCEVLFGHLKGKLDPAALAVTVLGEHYGIDTEVTREL